MKPKSTLIVLAFLISDHWQLKAECTIVDLDDKLLDRFDSSISRSEKTRGNGVYYGNAAYESGISGKEIPNFHKIPRTKANIKNINFVNKGNVGNRKNATEYPDDDYYDYDAEPSKEVAMPYGRMLGGIKDSSWIRNNPLAKNRQMKVPSRMGPNYYYNSPSSTSIPGHWDEYHYPASLSLMDRKLNTAYLQQSVDEMDLSENGPMQDGLLLGDFRNSGIGKNVGGLRRGHESSLTQGIKSKIGMLFEDLLQHLKRNDVVIEDKLLEDIVQLSKKPNLDDFENSTTDGNPTIRGLTVKTSSGKEVRIDSLVRREDLKNILAELMTDFDTGENHIDEMKEILSAFKVKHTQKSHSMFNKIFPFTKHNNNKVQKPSNAGKHEALQAEVYNEARTHGAGTTTNSKDQPEIKSNTQPQKPNEIGKISEPTVYSEGNTKHQLDSLNQPQQNLLIKDQNAVTTNISNFKGVNDASNKKAECFKKPGSDIKVTEAPNVYNPIAESGSAMANQSFTNLEVKPESVITHDMTNPTHNADLQVPTVPSNEPETLVGVPSSNLYQNYSRLNDEGVSSDTNKQKYMESGNEELKKEQTNLNVSQGLNVVSQNDQQYVTENTVLSQENVNNLASNEPNSNLTGSNQEIAGSAPTNVSSTEVLPPVQTGGVAQNISSNEIVAGAEPIQNIAPTSQDHAVPPGESFNNLNGSLTLPSAQTDPASRNVSNHKRETRRYRPGSYFWADRYTPTKAKRSLLKPDWLAVGVEKNDNLESDTLFGGNYPGGKEKKSGESAKAEAWTSRNSVGLDGVMPGGKLEKQISSPPKDDYHPLNAEVSVAPDLIEDKEPLVRSTLDDEIIEEATTCSPYKPTQPCSTEAICHPPEGPAKSPDESGSPDRSTEYEDALTGKLANRIIEVILAKVQKVPKLQKEFGLPSGNSCRLQETLPPAHESCDDGAKRIRESVLKDIAYIIDTMPLESSSQKCVPLTPDLRCFLEWLTQSSPRSASDTKAKNAGKFDRHNNKVLGSNFYREPETKGRSWLRRDMYDYPDYETGTEEMDDGDFEDPPARASYFRNSRSKPNIRDVSHRSEKSSWQPSLPYRKLKERAAEYAMQDHPTSFGRKRKSKPHKRQDDYTLFPDL